MIEYICINSRYPPLKVRSASFDEIQLDHQRTNPYHQYLRQQSTSAADGERCDLLTVPQPHAGGQRSRSFDSAGNDAFLEVPKRFQRRRSSNLKTPPPCIHCQYLDEYDRDVSADQRYFIDHNEVKLLGFSDVSSSDEEYDDEGGGGGGSNEHEDNDDDDDEAWPKFGNLLCPPALNSPGIVFTLSPTSNDDALPPVINHLGFPGPNQPGSPPLSPAFQLSSIIEPIADTDDPTPTTPTRQRRRSMSRQEAIFVEPTGNSLENVADAESTSTSRNTSDTSPQPTAADIVQDIYLAVPDLRRDRAASVDSCFSKVSPSGGKTEELKLPDGAFTLTVPVNSNSATRSRSVDIVLPTDEQARYKALAMASGGGPSVPVYLIRG